MNAKDFAIPAGRGFQLNANRFSHPCRKDVLNAPRALRITSLAGCWPRSRNPLLLRCHKDRVSAIAAPLRRGQAYHRLAACGPARRRGRWLTRLDVADEGRGDLRFRLLSVPGNGEGSPLPVRPSRAVGLVGSPHMG